MADMWQYEIDPNKLPRTPLRSYRLYTEDGKVLAGWFSVSDGPFTAFKVESSIRVDRKQDKTPREVQTEIERYRELYGPVTLRARSDPNR